MVSAPLCTVDEDSTLLIKDRLLLVHLTDECVAQPLVQAQGACWALHGQPRLRLSRLSHSFVPLAVNLITAPSPQCHQTCRAVMLNIYTVYLSRLFLQ